jgi:GNAT superfamily N-acetyltransferase
MHADLAPSVSRTIISRSKLLGSRVKRLTPEEMLGAYTLLEHVEHLYPGFRIWFARKVIPGCLEGSRAIFTTVDEKTKNISGIAILKRDRHEQKICTLFVHPDHIGRGNGARLLAEGLTWLGNSRPIITVAEKRCGIFSPLFKRHGFELTSKVCNLYRVGETEYIFNDFTGLTWRPPHPAVVRAPDLFIGERRNVNANARPRSSCADTTLSGNLNWDAYS